MLPRSDRAAVGNLLIYENRFFIRRESLYYLGKSVCRMDLRQTRGHGTTRGAPYTQQMTMMMMLVLMMMMMLMIIKY